LRFAPACQVRGAKNSGTGHPMKCSGLWLLVRFQIEFTNAYVWVIDPMKKFFDPLLITFRPIKKTQEDMELLFKVYASTREEEMTLTGWNKEEIDAFLRMQFGLQHKQYMENYKNAAFEIILYNKIPVGRLYVDHRKDDIRIIDIALLPEFRRRGIGTKIMRDLIAEADQKQIKLSLHVEQNNPAMNLYEKLYFKKSKITGVYFFMERKPRKFKNT
jgi:ribosomal protein S18 acetylase RimI-like enzyme